VALAEGGALESVQGGQTGVFFEDLTPRSLSTAIDKVRSLRFNKADLRDWALGFSEERFKENIRAFVASRLRRKSDGV